VDISLDLSGVLRIHHPPCQERRGAEDHGEAYEVRPEIDEGPERSSR